MSDVVLGLEANANGHILRMQRVEVLLARMSQSPPLETIGEDDLDQLEAQLEEAEDRISELERGEEDLECIVEYLPKEIAYSLQEILDFTLDNTLLRVCLERFCAALRLQSMKPASPDSLIDIQMLLQLYINTT